MVLPLYTNTYADVDASKFTSDNLVNEFTRVASFLNPWVSAIQLVDGKNVFSEQVGKTGNVVTVSADPGSGVLQRFTIDDDVNAIVVDFGRRAVGDPYRVNVILRFQKKSTTFQVSGPLGSTHLFGLNRKTYTPSQVIGNKFYYTAILIATYGGSNGVMVNVFANNTEATTVSGNDILSSVSA